MRKILQMKLYSLLSTKWGMALLLIGLFFSFNSLLQFLMLLISTKMWIPEIAQISPSNNTKYAVNDYVCIPKIDIVYTWVNGSDPRHIQALRDMKFLLKGERFIPCNATQKEGENNCTKDEETASRFVDNHELKYSLRSIERYAPWAQHIYLVTNGQIPHWLNLTHPRLTVITHDQIFENKSHLPSFSSPAIEANLHRIPNLADRFIYFNDDTMLGNEVWPDDFFSQSSGQKIFLSWPVPNCNDGCPANWIGDGYCDAPCNVSDCDWDADDCKNVTSTTGGRTSGGGNAGGNWWNNGGFNKGDKDGKYCAANCPDTWIGDKYCDRNCKVADCGFDAGDCDTAELFNGLYGVALEHDGKKLHLVAADGSAAAGSSGDTIEIPKGTMAMYFNLSGVVGDNKIVDGSHDNSDLVRTATISQKYKLMTLTFHREKPKSTVVISITHEVAGNRIETVWNVTVDTHVERPPENATAETENVNGTLVPGNGTAEIGTNTTDAAPVSAPLTTALPPQTFENKEAKAEDEGKAPFEEQNPIKTKTQKEEERPPPAATPNDNPFVDQLGATPSDPAPPVKNVEVKPTEKANKDMKEAYPEYAQQAKEEKAKEEPQGEQKVQVDEEQAKAGGAALPVEDVEVEPVGVSSPKVFVKPEDVAPAELLRPDAGSGVATPGEEEVAIAEAVRLDNADIVGLNKEIEIQKAQDETPRENKGAEVDADLAGDSPIVEDSRAIEASKNAVDGSNIASPEEKNDEPVDASLNRELNMDEEINAIEEVDVAQNENSQDEKAEQEQGDVQPEVGGKKPPLRKKKGKGRNLLSFEEDIDDFGEQKDVAAISRKLVQSARIAILDEDGILPDKYRKKLEEEKKRAQLKMEDPHGLFVEEFGPWELKEDLGDFEYHMEELMEEVAMSRQYRGASTRRRLLDHYADSLKFVNRLLNKEFGASSRKVPAHMPHYLDKRILLDLHEKWKEHWDATSSHQLRDKHDMQFAFAYMYFMAHQRVEFSFERVWNEYLDMDHDGVLNANELRTLAVHIYGVPVSPTTLADLEAKLLNVSAIILNSTESSENGTAIVLEEASVGSPLAITFNTLLNCSEVRTKIEKHFGKKAKNKHHTAESDEVAFLMIGNNATNVQKSLDGIRERRQKFICLNDNMNHADPNSADVVRVLGEFYESLYPLPSSFELVNGTVNQFLHLDEIVKEQTEVIAEEGGILVYVVIGILTVSVCFVCWRVLFSCTRDQRMSKRDMKYRKMLNA
eukprot:TRINITY_DN1353_c0_g2_i5.p1 TRINITY_DN1353_c0_g2~~TRINITY_DN1353_c0_g2_i5.p1  ORF type:complete len:1245 (+),score=388.40 TRINITY_DN1353_c0_g2_i5:191-3925(+)